MGQIADDIRRGFQCSWCGICFVEEHGYPVVCVECYEGATAKEIKDSGVQESIYNEL